MWIVIHLAIDIRYLENNEKYGIKQQEDLFIKLKFKYFHKTQENFYADK